jgi:hypothetical protein
MKRAAFPPPPAQPAPIETRARAMLAHRLRFPQRYNLSPRDVQRMAKDMDAALANVIDEIKDEERRRG